jgi:DNA modification methylase
MVATGCDRVSELISNSIHRGDCLNILKEHIPDESVDLIYLDPPFNTGKCQTSGVNSFTDTWSTIQEYVSWMRERMIELHRVLKPTGSIYVHCDYHASHYLKVMMDEVFGTENFRSEIIWKRTTAHSSANRYSPVHDVILYYGASKEVTWKTPRQMYTDEYLDKYYRFDDDGDGRYHSRDNLTGAGRRTGPSGLPWRGFDPNKINRHWSTTPEELDRLDAEGRIYWPTGGKGFPRYKRYRDELQGRTVGDIWTDIGPINSMGSERLGYPTQKPEALLERIIAASSNHDDIVLDPFCGSGTTLAAAQQLGRRWVGIDSSQQAVNVSEKRLRALVDADQDLFGEALRYIG